MKQERFQLFVMIMFCFIAYVSVKPHPELYHTTPLGFNAVGAVGVVLVAVYIFDVARDLWALRPGWLAG
jgi:hypothetical protein